MKNKLLIVGLKSFLGQNLYQYLKKKKIKVSIISFENFNNKFNKLNEFDFIINCSSNNSYINKKYNKRYDNDFIISKKIKNYKTKLIFLSSRRVYKNNYNIKENSKIETVGNYSKNKYNSENKLFNTLGKKLLILRISNVIGLPLRANKRRKIHKTFIDIFKENIKKGFILRNHKIFKDFIGIQKFAEIIYTIIKKNVDGGIYNISLGKKVYVDDIAKWLNSYNKEKAKNVESKSSYYNTDCFTLNNKKIMKIIKIKNNIGELKKESIKISKILFK